MTENNEDQQIQEPAQVVEQLPQQPTDHIPLKDQFSSDLSEIDFLQYTEKQVEAQTSQKVIVAKPKKKKIIRSFWWKHRWVKQTNAVSGSAPIWIKRWVKVKYVPTEQELVSYSQQQQGEKDRGALEMAHAIILEQMNQQH